MIIAGGHVFPVRSLAIARSLLPYSLRGAGMCAVFASSFFRYSIMGRRLRMSAWRLAARPSSRPAARGLVSPLCSLFIVHPCRSKQEAAFFSSITVPRSPRAPVPSNPPPVASLPVVSFASPIPSCSSLTTLVPSCRLAARLVPSSRFRLARCASRLAARLVVAPFCPARLAVLPIPCRPCRPLVVS